MADINVIDGLTYEQALAELEGIVTRLEMGGLALDESLSLFERGQALAAYCGAHLDQAELRIKQVTPQGEVPFELPS